MLASPPPVRAATANPDAPRDWSIAPTLGWFIAILLATLFFLDGGIASIRDLVDQDPSGDDDGLGPQAAGPAFVQQEAERQQLPTDDELDEDWGADPTRVAEADGAGDADVHTARTGVEDVCIDGTDASCKRWAMDGFYQGLAAAKRRPARISLWGDSVTAEGYIAGGMRTRISKAHGDGGAGFVFLAKPSRWYQNTAVRQTQSEGWVINSVVHNTAADGLHGYGGAAFTGTAGDTATFKTAKRGAGSKVSRFELYYLASPKGGEVELSVDGEVVQTVDTKADQAGSGYAAVDVDDGAHTLTVRVTRGKVRTFGVTMERGSGVAVDSLGIVSNTAKNMAGINPAHWREQLAHRDADLMMILLGTNESAWLKGAKSFKEYQQRWSRLLASVRKGNPDGSCLVIGTLDAGALVGGKKYVGRTSIDAMIKAERAAAVANGCAFWDSRAYMGGKDSARAWYKKGLMSGDFEHLTKKGGHVLGSGIVEALEAGYAGSRSR